MSNFDCMLTNLALLNENELEALAKACQTRVDDKKSARRKALGKELMINLQQAIDAILDNDFNLAISNTDRDPYDRCAEVRFIPADHYSIEME